MVRSAFAAFVLPMVDQPLRSEAVDWRCLQKSSQACGSTPSRFWGSSEVASFFFPWGGYGGSLSEDEDEDEELEFAACFARAKPLAKIALSAFERSSADSENHSPSMRCCINMP